MTQTAAEKKTVTITCVDCKAERTINKGEEFQVKRCVDCQEKHRKELRKQSRKNRVKKLQARVALLESCLNQAGLPIPALTTTTEESEEKEEE